MKVKVLYFAILRDAAAKAEEEFEVQENTDAIDLHQMVKQKYQGFLDLSQLRVAINEECVEEHRTLQENDVVCFIPPVAGG